MIVSVADFSGTVVIDSSRIAKSEEQSYIYGMPYVARISLRDSSGIESLIVGDEYQVEYSDRPRVRLAFLGATLDDSGRSNYDFVHKSIYQMKNNLMPNKSSAFSIKFDRYVTGRGNQFEYFLEELRKKGMVLVNDTLLAPTAVAINEVLGRKVAIAELSSLSFREVSPKLERFNYYTKIPKESVHRTTNGIGFPVFKPFISAGDVSGLNNYLVLSGELRSESSQLLNPPKTGDTIIIKGVVSVFIRVEMSHERGVSRMRAFTGVRASA